MAATLAEMLSWTSSPLPLALVFVFGHHPQRLAKILLVLPPQFSFAPG